MCRYVKIAIRWKSATTMMVEALHIDHPGGTSTLCTLEDVHSTGTPVHTRALLQYKFFRTVHVQVSVHVYVHCTRVRTLSTRVPVLKYQGK